MKNTISAKQTAVIASIMIFSNKILTLPSLLYKYGKGDSLLILLMMFLIELGVLFIFFSLKQRFKTESLFKIISQNWGKALAIIIYVVLILYFFIKLLTSFNVNHIYFKMQVYHNDQKSIFLFTSLIIIALTTIGGFRPLCRTLQFFFIPIITGLLFCLFISFSNFSTTLQLFETPVASFFEGAYKYCFAFGDFLFLFLIMDRIEYDKNQNKQILKYVLISMAIMLVGYFLFFSIFQYTAFMHPNAVSDIIVLSYEIFDIGRLDIIAVITVMLLTFCQLSMYAYVLSVLFTSIFPKMSKIYSVALIVVVFLILYGFFTNSLDVVNYLTTTVMPIIAILLQYVLPLLTFTFKNKRRQT